METTDTVLADRIKVNLALDDIQGNILVPFNKPFKVFLFLNFQNSQSNARAWLTSLVEKICSTQQLIEHIAARQEKKAEPTAWVTVSLTSSALTTLHPEVVGDLVAYDAFWNGALAARQDRGQRRSSPAFVGDTREIDVTGLAVGHPEQIDALVTIAADNEDLRLKAAKDERDRAESRGLVVLEVRTSAGRRSSTEQNF